jgi:hypothetical protein
LEHCSNPVPNQLGSCSGRGQFAHAYWRRAVNMLGFLAAKPGSALTKGDLHITMEIQLWHIKSAVKPQTCSACLADGLPPPSQAAHAMMRRQRIESGASTKPACEAALPNKASA